MIDSLATLSGFSIIFPAMAFLVFCPLKTKSIIILKYFVFGSVVFELFFTITSWNSIYNVAFSYPYTLFEGLSLIAFFLFILEKRESMVIVLLISYVFLFIIDSISFEPLQSILSFNPFARSFNSLLMVSLSFLYYFQIYRQEKIIELDKDPSFYFVSGLLLYFSTSFFTFLFSAEIFELTNDKIETSWFFHSISNIGKNTLLTIGIWQARH